MKSEADFINEAKQYRLVDTATLAADFKRIYTEGRRDQHEADLMAIDAWSNSQESCAVCMNVCGACRDGITDAIRAAGPGEGE